jgi:hypothetical protein
MDKPRYVQSLALHRVGLELPAILTALGAGAAKGELEVVHSRDRGTRQTHSFKLVDPNVDVLLIALDLSATPKAPVVRVPMADLGVVLGHFQTALNRWM